MKRNLSIILFVMMLTNCSTIKTTPYDNTNIDKTLYYALPKTFLDITVEIKLTEIKNAPFAKFGVCYGITSELKEPSKSFSIESVQLETSSKLDVSKLYETRIINGFLNKTEFNNVYASNGELTSSEYTTESQGLKYVTSTIKFASSLFFGASTAGSTDIEKCLKNHIEEKDIEKVRKLVKRLEDLNGSIENINENAVDYSNPEVLSAHIKLINDEKKKIIEDNFGYSTKTFEQKLIFKIDPNQLDIKENKGNITKGVKTLLFKYDRVNGIISSSNMALDTQVWNRNKFESKVKKNENIVEVLIDLDVDNSYANAISKSDSYLNSIANGQNRENEKVNSASFYYRIPSYNRVSIYQCSDTIESGMTSKNEKLIHVKDDIQLTQFGRVIGAPKNLAKVKFELYPKTGALKSVSGNSAIVNVEQLSDLQSQLVDTKSSIKGEDDIDVEIKDLKKEVELLELLKKKADLEKESSEETDN